MRPFEGKSIQGGFWTLEFAYVTAVVERADLDSYDATDDVGPSTADGGSKLR